MDLAAYLAAHDLKPAAFAARIGVPASTVTRILRGERDPRGATIRKIVEGTGGAVTASDLLGSGPAAPREGAQAELPSPTPCPEFNGFTPERVA